MCYMHILYVYMCVDLVHKKKTQSFKSQKGDIATTIQPAHLLMFFSNGQAWARNHE